MLSLLSQNILHVQDALKQSPNFLNVKHDTTLNLYIAKHCHRSDTTQPLVRQCDGTVFNSDGKVVCYSGEYSEMYSYHELQNTENQEIGNALSNLSSFEVLEFLDGTCIRMYYHDGEWRVATKGHTDASKAKWSSEKSFLTLFEEALQNYPEFSRENLNKERTYVFLLQHVENKIVCPVESNRVYLLEVYENSTLNRVVESVTGVEEPKVLTVANSNELTVFLELNDETSKGVYLRNKENSQRLFILNKLYDERQKLKGNTLDMNKRYLELRSANRHYTFTQQFPEYGNIVEELEQNIQNNVKHIHQLYMSKHVRKETVQINQSEKKYLFPIHGYYLRTHQKMTPNVVMNLMFVIDTNFGLEKF